MSARILIVDDQQELCLLLQNLLSTHGFRATSLPSGAALRQALTGQEPDVVLLDLKLADADGLELLPLIKKSWPGTEVIVLTGHASLDAAVSATKLGAYDFQKKPFDHESLVHSIEKALEHKKLTEQASTLRRTLSNISGGSSPVFRSGSMKNVLRTVERVSPTDVSVLLCGESGTGKEVIADLLHSLSNRASGPLIKVNCAALPRDLIESELFGSVKGAFTGAHADRTGLFREADGGTLFLDEISEMPIDTQSKLLRVLQEQEVRPVGGRVSYKTNCRIIAATNRPVEDAIKEGKLREDLYYRVGAISISLPPLRERREDILPLAEAFLKRFAAQAARSIAGFTPEAGDLLRNHDWPGNVRQLQNEVQRAVLMCDGRQITNLDLSITESTASPEQSTLTLMEGIERNAIIQMLKETGGNKLETAKRLGIGRQTLYNKIKQYGIQT